MKILITAAALFAATPAFALTTADIDGAAYENGAVASGQSGLSAKLQILLDRAGISPGVIDGYKGDMSESALRGFEAREGLQVDGQLDAEVWEALGGPNAGRVMMDYTLTEEDVSDLTASIPDNVAEKAKLDKLGYTRVTERLAERFHMDEDFLKALNPDATFNAGETITVADTGPRLEAKATRVEIHKGDGRALVFDEAGKMIANYPVAIGSDETPSPSGELEVTAVAMNPTYSYNPDKNFTADGVTEKLTLPAGPNGPVGSVWIDLSEPTYGLHGTDTPAALFQNRSHGCVRFTNWDVEELAFMVSKGVKVVFKE